MKTSSLMEYPGDTREEKLLGRIYEALKDGDAIVATSVSVNDDSGKEVGRAPAILITDQDGREYIVSWHQKFQPGIA